MCSATLEETSADLCGKTKRREARVDALDARDDAHVALTEGNGRLVPMAMRRDGVRAVGRERLPKLGRCGVDERHLCC